MIREVLAARQRVPPPVSPEEALARVLAVAPNGLTLTALRAALPCVSRDRREEAIVAIRNASWTTERYESRPGGAGREQMQVVVRVRRT